MNDELDTAAPLAHKSEREAAPLPPSPAKPNRPKAGFDWIWGVAALSYFLIALLPIFDASKASQALGPALLGLAFGAACLARRPFAIAWGAAGLALLLGCGWLGWHFASDAWATWSALPAADRARALSEALRRLALGTAASLGLAAFRLGPKALSAAGAVVCAASSLAIAMGWLKGFF